MTTRLFIRIVTKLSVIGWLELDALISVVRVGPKRTSNSCSCQLFKLDNTCRARWPRRGSCVVGDQNWTHETSITAREAALFWFIFSEWSLLDHFWTHETSNTAREAALFWFKKWLQQTDIRQTDIRQRTNNEFKLLYTIAPSGQKPSKIREIFTLRALK